MVCFAVFHSYVHIVVISVSHPSKAGRTGRFDFVSHDRLSLNGIKREIETCSFRRRRHSPLKCYSSLAPGETQERVVIDGDKEHPPFLRDERRVAPAIVTPSDHCCPIPVSNRPSVSQLAQ